MSAAEDIEYYVVNAAICESTEIGEYFDDEIENPSIKEIQERLIKEANAKPVVVEYKKGSKCYYVWFDLAKPSEASIPKTIPSSFTNSSADVRAELEKAIAQPRLDTLKERLETASLVYTVFPEIVKSVKAMDVKVPEEFLGTVNKAAEDFAGRKEGLLKEYAPTKKNAESLTSRQIDEYEEIVNKQVDVVRGILNQLIGFLGPNPGPNPIPFCQRCKELETTISKKDSEIAELRGKLADAEKRIKELEERSICTIVDDPGLKNTEITLEPVKHSEKGYVLFFWRKSTYKFIYLEKEFADKLMEEGKLDPTKQVKCLVESVEHHCSSKGQMELANVYDMPKGEDYYLCKGKISQ